MKNLLTAILLISSFVSLEVQAQKNKSLVGTLEFSLGTGQVVISNDQAFTLTNGNYLDNFSQYSIFREPGYEVSAKILGTLRVNQQSEWVAGYGFNIWNYTVDRAGLSTGDLTSDFKENSSSLSFMMGYRYWCKSKSKIELFAESLVNTQVFLNSNFVIAMVSIEPGLGCKFHLSENLTLISALNYKIGLNDISYTLEQIHKIKVLGVRSGLSRII